MKVLYQIPAMIVLIIAGLPCMLTGQMQSNASYIDPRIGNVGQLLEPTRPLVHLPNQVIRFAPQRKTGYSRMQFPATSEPKLLLAVYNDGAPNGSSFRPPGKWKAVHPYGQPLLRRQQIYPTRYQTNQD
ncbi:MAG TPA: hypothetical protein VGM31_06870 [Puia sp.]